jgi:hypothetical protein
MGNANSNLLFSECFRTNTFSLYPFLNKSKLIENETTMSNLDDKITKLETELEKLKIDMKMLYTYKES